KAAAKLFPGEPAPAAASPAKATFESLFGPDTPAAPPAEGDPAAEAPAAEGEPAAEPEAPADEPHLTAAQVLAEPPAEEHAPAGHTAPVHEGAPAPAEEGHPAPPAE